MKSLKLKQMAQNTLSEVELGKLQGGDWCCGCGCAYASSGGSSTTANKSANYNHGYYPKNSTVEKCCEVNAATNELECGYAIMPPAPVTPTVVYGSIGS